MTRQVESAITDAAHKIAMTLKPEHWQALVAVKGVVYPFTMTEKVRLVREILIKEEG